MRARFRARVPGRSAGARRRVKWAREGPFQRARRAVRSAVARRRVEWVRGPVSARRRSACLGARAGSGGRRLLAGRPGCVCGLPVSWRSLCRHARRSSWMARSESAARPFRAPGEPGGGEAVPRASWRLLRDPRNVRRLGVIRGTGPYGFASKTRTKEGLRLASRYTSLSSPPERRKHTPWPPQRSSHPPPPKRAHPGSETECYTS